MKTATMHQAKTNLSKYADAAKRGESVTFGYRGKPELQITSLPAPSARPTGKRKLGMFKGQMTISNDAFSKELDEEIAREMYGEND